MEKLVKVPFDMETAKKIQSGEIEGKITTRGGRDARVIYWEKKGDMPIVALIQDFDGIEVAFSYPTDGRYVSVNKDHEFDLLIQVPEWETFKAGGLIDVGGGLYLISSTPKRCNMANDKGMDDKGLNAKFVAKAKEGHLYINFEEAEVYSFAEFTKATKEQRKKFIRLLKEDGSDKANKILEKYFGIKTKSKYKTGDILYLKDKSGASFVFINNVTAGISSQYCVLPTETKSLIFAGVYPIYGERVTELRYATKEEKQILRDALIKDGRAEAKEYLAEFFKEEAYEDGDILYVKGHTGKDFVFIYKAGKEKTRAYCSVCLVGRDLYVEEARTCYEDRFQKLRYATEAEKNILIEALKKSDKDAAKDHLKRFFNIEQEHKFKPFDKVLVRNEDGDEWKANIFSNYCEGNLEHKYDCVAYSWKQCIPYIGNEKLLGTTDEPKH